MPKENIKLVDLARNFNTERLATVKLIAFDKCSCHLAQSGEYSSMCDPCKIRGVLNQLAILEHRIRVEKSNDNIGNRHPGSQ